MLNMTCGNLAKSMRSPPPPSCRRRRRRSRSDSGHREVNTAVSSSSPSPSGTRNRIAVIMAMLAMSLCNVGPVASAFQAGGVELRHRPPSFGLSSPSSVPIRPQRMGCCRSSGGRSAAGCITMIGNNRQKAAPSPSRLFAEAEEGGGTSTGGSSNNTLAAEGEVGDSSTSTYAYDADEDVEQRIADHTAVAEMVAEAEEADDSGVDGESEGDGVKAGGFDDGGGVSALDAIVAEMAAEREEEEIKEAAADHSASPSPVGDGGAGTGAEEVGRGGRYAKVLEEVGLTDKLRHARDLPDRVISTNDIFCNREIRLSGIKAVGFDMDYTLAQYIQPAFDRLAFDGARDKLVNTLGYPEEVLKFDYDHEFWVRGLIIDTQRGNFLKIDRHKYVRLAYHGFRPISSSVRKSLYSRTFNKIPSFSEKHFVNLDTLFQSVDAHLFAHLVELKDSDDHSPFMDGKTYEEMYRDVRACVDLCHRDGVIKDVVADDPASYIVNDPGVVPMLRKFREGGVKVFLLTNSYWEYTSVAMNFLYHGKKVDDPEVFGRNEWLELFDIVVVGSCKPAYLIDPYLNLFRVNPRDGTLLNTDGIYEIEALEPNGAEKFLSKGKVFQGGNWLHLQAMLQTRAGEEILYVGDHLYADVLRSKRTLGWRTALIVPEMTKEMEAFRANLALSNQIEDLRKLRDEMSAWGDELRERLAEAEVAREGEDDDADADADEALCVVLRRQIRELDEDDARIKEVLTGLAERYHEAFHPVWGQMFLAGYQDSRLAFYVENYACLYTSKASNLGRVSTERSFRTSGERLPHDKLVSDPANIFVEGE